MTNETTTAPAVDLHRIPDEGDPEAHRDQLAAMAAEALSQRDRLLFALGAVLEQFPKPDELPTGMADTSSRFVPVRRLREWWAVIHTLKSIDVTPLTLTALASTSTATEEPTKPARVPADLPCPKCGDADVRVRYCDGCKSRRWNDLCEHGSREHFHRTCGRCHYPWLTFDALDARVVCES